MAEGASVAILMSTFNGARYLGEQLDSIFAQSSVSPHLFVRDDASNDSTIELIERYRRDHNVSISLMLPGPEGNVGPYRSWKILLGEVPRRYDYYAISDQDDIWHPEKLSTAIEALCPEGDTPAVYTCNSTAVTEDLRVIREYDFSVRAASLPSLFARYSVPAHAMVINSSLLGLVDRFDVDATDSRFTLEHQIVLGALSVGGRWVRGSASHVQWRRVGASNVTAAGNGVFRRLRFESLKFRERGVRTAWAATLLSTPGLEVTPDSREFLSMVLSAQHDPMARIRLAASRKLSTGKILFDTASRFRVLWPDW